MAGKIFKVATPSKEEIEIKKKLANQVRKKQSSALFTSSKKGGIHKQNDDLFYENIEKAVKSTKLK